MIQEITRKFKYRFPVNAIAYDLHNFKKFGKIVIIGYGGAGKSTLARDISEKLSIKFRSTTECYGPYVEFLKTDRQKFFEGFWENVEEFFLKDELSVIEGTGAIEFVCGPYSEPFAKRWRPFLLEVPLIVMDISIPRTWFQIFLREVSNDEPLRFLLYQLRHLTLLDFSLRGPIKTLMKARENKGSVIKRFPITFK